MYRTADPVWDAEIHIDEQDKRLARRPVCDCCGCRITEDTALHYKGLWLCGECVSDNEEYIEEDDEWD